MHQSQSSILDSTANSQKVEKSCSCSTTAKVYLLVTAAMSILSGIYQATTIGQSFDGVAVMNKTNEYGLQFQRYSTAITVLNLVDSGFFLLYGFATIIGIAISSLAVLFAALISISAVFCLIIAEAFLIGLSVDDTNKSVVLIITISLKMIIIVPVIVCFIYVIWKLIRKKKTKPPEEEEQPETVVVFYESVSNEND